MNISEIYDPTAIADHYHQRIRVLAQAIKAQGFRVWIAKAGNYGFYSNTEGSSLVSFTINLTVLHFSGNIESKTLAGKEVSWRLDDGTYEEMLKQPLRHPCRLLLKVVGSTRLLKTILPCMTLLPNSPKSELHQFDKIS